MDLGDEPEGDVEATVPVSEEDVPSLETAVRILQDILSAAATDEEPAPEGDLAPEEEPLPPEPEEELMEVETEIDEQRLEEVISDITDRVTKRILKEALAKTEMGAYSSGLQGTSLAAQARGQAAQQMQLTAQQGEAQYGQQIAGLHAQEGTTKAGLIAQGAQAQAGAKAAVPAYMAQLAQAEANMRGGISYQGAATQGLLGAGLSAFAKGWGIGLGQGG